MKASPFRESVPPPVARLSDQALWRAVTAQGALVTYERPPDRIVEPEPTGTQTGVVVSSNDYNRSGVETLHVCPLERTMTGKLFPRPELITSVAIRDLDPMISDATKRPFVPLPLYRLKPIIDEFIDIITPTFSKMNEKPEGWNLAYGQIGFFYSIPRSQDSMVLDYNLPGLWLTPRDVFKKAGIGFVARTYSNIRNGDPKHDVVEVVPSFLPERICTSNLQALSPLRIKENSQRARFDERAIRGFVSKIKAHFYEEDAQRVRQKYEGDRGDLLPFVSDAVARFHRYNRDSQQRLCR